MGLSALMANPYLTFQGGAVYFNLLVRVEMVGVLGFEPKLTGSEPVFLTN